MADAQPADPVLQPIAYGHPVVAFFHVFFKVTTLSTTASHTHSLQMPQVENKCTLARLRPFWFTYYVGSSAATSLPTLLGWWFC